ncbi:hypothetical protein CERSUDRAFT_120151 [Gelatoporia subvermispora B]|uniref:Uncharacterized protein n=1 Tax=Ceriporiopsis subvermispora (strain B) TaxID=914234 RepID=M2QWX4_CERS8|nr:hypothetical protein CERSUDRAFT_120151 [Gelatoporia subvermispora B]
MLTWITLKIPSPHEPSTKGYSHDMCGLCFRHEVVGLDRRLEALDRVAIVFTATLAASILVALLCYTAPIQAEDPVGQESNPIVQDGPNDSRCMSSIDWSSSLGATILSYITERYL